MDPAELILLAAAGLLLLDLFQLRGSRGGEIGWRGYPAALAACVLVASSYAYFALAFLRNEFFYEEVYLYSSSGLSPLVRFYASWASGRGSWLFLTFLLSSGYLILRLRSREGFRRPAFEFLDFLTIFFIFIVVVESPFELLPFRPPEGQGLNPLLQTPWMIVHPPVVFAGYVLVFLGYALTLPSLRSGGSREPVDARALLQSAWLLLTMGIALGGLWAYEVLGWGGYWAWDPVETASLLPWLALTAYFHMPPSVSGSPSSSRGVMVTAAAAMVVLASAITRGGLAVSVHTFGASLLGPALLVLLVAVVGFFLYFRRGMGAPLFELDLGLSSVYSASVAFSFISLVSMAFVCSWGVLYPILRSLITGASASMGAEFFVRWNYPLVILFVASLAGCHLSSRLSPKRMLGLVTALAGLGVASALFQFPTPNSAANFGLPFLLASLAAVIYSGLSSLLGGLRGTQLFRSLIHMGVIVVLIGVFFSSSSGAEIGEFVVSQGEVLQVGDRKISFGGFRVVMPSGMVFAEDGLYPEAACLEVPVNLDYEGANHGGLLKIYLYTLHGFLSKPLIFRGLRSDVYMTIVPTDSVYDSLLHNLMGVQSVPEVFVLYIMESPLVNLIWVGVAMMCLGMASLIPRRPTTEASGAHPA